MENGTTGKLCFYGLHYRIPLNGRNYQEELKSSAKEVVERLAHAVKTQDKQYIFESKLALMIAKEPSLRYPVCLGQTSFPGARGGEAVVTYLHIGDNIWVIPFCSLYTVEDGIASFKQAPASAARANFIDGQYARAEKYLPK